MCEIKVESEETTTIGVERTFAVGLLKHRRGRWQRCELFGMGNDRCKLKFEADDDRQTDKRTGDHEAGNSISMLSRY